MNSKKSRNFVKKATALFSAIAASSFLGLPAFAQANSNTPNTNESQYLQNQSGSGSNRISYDCVPADMNQSSSMNQSDRSSASSSTNSTTAGAATSGMSTSDTAAYNNRQFSNQTDPRTVAPSVSSMRGNEGGDSSATQSQLGANAGSNGSNGQNMANGQTGTVQSGDVPFGDRNTGNQTDQTITTPVAPTGQTSQGGVGGPVDSGSSNQNARDYSGSQNSQNYSNSQTSQSYGSQSNVGYPHALYHNVLGRGGATTGGFARQNVESANNPNRQPDEFYNRVSYRDRDGNSNYQASNYGTQSSDSQIQTSGVTSGGEAANQSRTSATDLNRSTSGSSSMNSGTQMASCPPGMVPRRSMNNNQQYQNNNQQYQNQSTPDVRTNPGDSNVPGRALPNVRQTPDTGR